MSICLCNFGRDRTAFKTAPRCRATRLRASGELICDREVGVEEAIRSAVVDTPTGGTVDDLRVDALAALRALVAAGWVVRTPRRKQAPGADLP